MKVRVLGSSAGGGFPQWNCGCPNCAGVRRSSIRAVARTQESVALGVPPSDRWLVINASPDIGRQIESWPALHPRGLRDSPLLGVVLTNGDLDHCLGLLCLREDQPLSIFATERVWSTFHDSNAFSRTLRRFSGHVTWRPLVLGEEQRVDWPDDPATAVTLVPFAVPGKVPLHMQGAQSHPEDNIGLLVKEIHTNRTMLYLSNVGGPFPDAETLLGQAACAFFDGTFWTSDELVRLGVGSRRAEEMAHWPLSGQEGSLALLERFPGRRRVLIHINNTNPILREDSPERRRVEQAGVEVATDGLEIDL
jgi:pyrroloquinoline quinone biosynthesis protein B